jgi:hypothetical protein
MNYRLEIYITEARLLCPGLDSCHTLTGVPNETDGVETKAGVVDPCKAQIITR